MLSPRCEFSTSKLGKKKWVNNSTLKWELFFRFQSRLNTHIKRCYILPFKQICDFHTYNYMYAYMPWPIYIRVPQNGQIWMWPIITLHFRLWFLSIILLIISYFICWMDIPRLKNGVGIGCVCVCGGGGDYCAHIYYIYHSHSDIWQRTNLKQTS